MTKEEHLKKLMTDNGRFAISALDHRGLLKKMLHPENPGITSDEEIHAWKNLMVGNYKNEVSGLLVDPTFGRDLIDTTAQCGWIFSMEQTGYEGEGTSRVTTLIPDWDVAQAKRLGASAVKLLLYYDPEQKELAQIQKATALKVAEACQKEDMVFLLEPLSYNPTQDPNIVEKIVTDLIDVPVDIFKLEYPGDRERCERITRLLTVPWVLLSAGAAYETYTEQLIIACSAGARGMAVGRAAWQEFGELEGEERERFLRETAVKRIRDLTAIVLSTQ